MKPTRRHPVIVKVQRALAPREDATKILVYSEDEIAMPPESFDVPGFAEARLGVDLKGYFEAWYQPDGKGGLTLVIGDRVADQDW